MSAQRNTYSVVLDVDGEQIGVIDTTNCREAFRAAYRALEGFPTVSSYITTGGECGRTLAYLVSDYYGEVCEIEVYPRMSQTVHTLNPSWVGWTR